MTGFCDLLIEHMSRGYSFETFGAEIRYPQRIVQQWVHDKRSFAEAKGIGAMARQKTLEGLLMSKQINLETYEKLVFDEETEIDASISNFDDAVLINARERFNEGHN